ncbi:MAG TPA: Mur ligase family protein [Opitutaceae bacterium]|jgi:UDP-N-acetylmuramate: L-alanyl-gamma-D-glutamyl-meso-diaminopimelate ligase
MKLYFMGICGTAMGNAALIARAGGHEVSGADEKIYPPMSGVLSNAGIEVLLGYSAERLAGMRPDLVVIGNAMSRGNPEVEWLLESRALPFTSLPALLSDLVLRKRRNVVIAGTHGKTTTSAICAFLLRANGRDPGFLIGGVPQDPPVGSHLGGETDPFVIEGDEYDSAFFDKRSKFIHYAPHVAVFNNLEFDHADIFRDLADVQRTFVHFSRIIPRNGYAVINGDDGNLKVLGQMPWTTTIRVGQGPHNDCRIMDFAEDATGTSFRLLWKGKEWGTIKWRLPGLYNARNAAMAATAAGLAMDGGPLGISLGLLSDFRGVKRRQEVLVSTPTISVIEDFGHHPTAILETLRSLRARYPGHALTAVFEPRSNTARLRILQAGFERALSNADDVYLGPVSRAGALRDEERFDAEAVAQNLEAQGVGAKHFASNEGLHDALVADTLRVKGSPRVVVFFSNGSFDGIISRFAAAAAG